MGCTVLTGDHARARDGEAPTRGTKGPHPPPVCRSRLTEGWNEVAPSRITPENGRNLVDDAGTRAATEGTHEETLRRKPLVLSRQRSA